MRTSYQKQLERKQWENLNDVLDLVFEAADDMTLRHLAKISGLSYSTVCAMYHRTRRRYQYRSVCLLTLAVGKELGVIE